jgi:hypothetical protein
MVTGTRPWHQTCTVSGLNPGKLKEAGHVQSRDQICLEIVIVAQLPSQISPTKNLATVKIEMTEHVRLGLLESGNGPG